MSAGAPDASALAEALLAQYTRCRAIVAEFDDDLPRDLRGIGRGITHGGRVNRTKRHDCRSAAGYNKFFHLVILPEACTGWIVSAAIASWLIADTSHSLARVHAAMYPVGASAVNLVGG